MTRESIIARNQHRIQCVKVSEDAKTRKIIKKEIKSNMANQSLSLHEKIAKNYKLVQQLDSLKRDSSACRVRNICGVCGRARGFIRHFGLCRICIRYYANEIPGLKKAS